MENEKVVECWCCKHFTLRDNHDTGACALKWKIVPAHDKVCEDFVMLKGLYTNRTIPDYCKNYK